MKEKYKFYKREVLEDEIDLAAIFVFLLSKWRQLLLCGIIGLVLGLPLGLFMAKNNLLDVEDLSGDIVSQLDNYVEQKKLNEKLNADDRDLYFMSLDPDTTYYQTVLNYTIRTDNHEDIELASKYLDLTQNTAYLEELVQITGYSGYIKNLKGILTFESEISEAAENSGMNYINGYSSGTGSSTNSTTQAATPVSPEASSEGSVVDDETVAQLQTAIAEAASSGDTENLSELISSLNTGQSYAYLTFTSSYLNKEQSDLFITWLKSEIESIANDNCSAYSGFKIRFITSNTFPLRQTDIQRAQQNIMNTISDRATQVDIDVEKMLTRYATSITATATAEGSPAIIEASDKEKYEEYWQSLTDPEYENHLSKKTILLWMIITGILFGFGAVCYFLVIYLTSPAPVDEYKLREDYHLPIIGYTEQGRIALKGLDKVFSAKLNGMEVSSFDYLADSVSKTEVSPIVVLKTTTERDFPDFIELLKAKTGKPVVCGDLASDVTVLDGAIEAGLVFIVAELGKTQVPSLEATLHLVEYYDLKLGGVIMI